MDPMNDFKANLTQLEEHVPEQLHPLLEYLVNNLKTVCLVLGGIVAAVGIYVGIQAYQEHEENVAARELGTIMATQTGQQRIASLEAFVESAPGRMKTSALFELAESAMDQKKFDEAAKYWGRIGKAGDLEIVAELGRAKCLFLSGDAAGAMKLLTPLAQSAPESYKLPVNRLLGAAAEKVGDTAAAQTAYEQVVALDNSPERQFYQDKLASMQPGS